MAIERSQGASENASDHRACGVLRRESRTPSDVVESLSLPELLARYSCSSVGDLLEERREARKSGP